MVATVDVLVVGAGPTGLLLGAELCRRGVACRIIDEHPAPMPWDRATVVHPRSLEVFESLGIVEQLLAGGVKQRYARIHSSGKVLGEIDLSLCGSRYGFNLGVSEEVTESVLTDYLHTRGGEVARSSRLSGLEDRDGGVLATIEHNGATEQVFAQWIVGCDGSHSAARKLGGIELDGHGIPQAWAVFDTTVEGWPDSYEANYDYLEEVPLILTALPGERWRAYVRPNSPDSDLVKDAWSTMSRYLPNGRFADIASPTRFHCDSKVARQFKSGRILLAGDAAHLCTPGQGHGMNTGLMDGFNLAWKLALVCQGHSSGALLDSYEFERRPVAESIIASGDEFEHAQTLTDPAERLARDQMLQTKFADPTGRHNEAVAQANLDIDYGDSPIVMGDKHDKLAPGQRLPDTIGVHLASGEPAKLHELAHCQGHTALVLGGASADSKEVGRLESEIRARGQAPVIETVSALSARSDDANPHARLSPASAQRLGVDGIALLVVRPDGYLALRADRNHLDAYSAYLARLRDPPSAIQSR